jgi:hypothetical protein
MRMIRIFIITKKRKVFFDTNVRSYGSYKIMYFLKNINYFKNIYKIIFLLYAYSSIFCSPILKDYQMIRVMRHTTHTKAVRIYIFTLSAKKLCIIKDTRTHFLFFFF